MRKLADALGVCGMEVSTVVAYLPDDDGIDDAVEVECELVDDEPERESDAQRESELSEQALRHADSEGLELKKTAGESFVGVRPWPPRGKRLGPIHRGAGHQYFAVRRKPGTNEVVCLGSFVTAEEGALAYARSLAAHPPGAASASAYHGAGMTAEEAAATAANEGITLIRAPGTISGFKGVGFDVSKKKPYPYSVAISKGGVLKHIGRFLTAEEAALEYARAIGAAEAAKAVELAEVPQGSGSIFHPGYAAPPVQTREEVLRQAAAEGLTLHGSDRHGSGFKGVHKQKQNCKARPYLAKLRKPRAKHLGTFPTAEQAALAYARALAANPGVE